MKIRYKVGIIIALSIIPAVFLFWIFIGIHIFSECSTTIKIVYSDSKSFDESLILDTLMSMSDFENMSEWFWYGIRIEPPHNGVGTITFPTSTLPDSVIEKLESIDMISDAKIVKVICT
ncbi:MAG: hypothetical protein KGZ37_00855 [Nitrosarchaeum sp.]|nr:hypothetical protein [Nitrosarchaeum sp.]